MDKKNKEDDRVDVSEAPNNAVIMVQMGFQPVVARRKSWTLQILGKSGYPKRKIRIMNVNDNLVLSEEEEQYFLGAQSLDDFESRRKITPINQNRLLVGLRFVMQTPGRRPIVSPDVVSAIQTSYQRSRNSSGG